MKRRRPRRRADPSGNETMCAGERMTAMETRREFLATVGVGLLGTRSRAAQTAGAQAAEPGRCASIPTRKGEDDDALQESRGLSQRDRARRRTACGSPSRKRQRLPRGLAGQAAENGEDRIEEHQRAWASAAATSGWARTPRRTGIFQTDMSGKTISHRQIPLGGGGCHGVE